MEADKMFTSFLKLNDNYERAMKLIRKNKKKIKWMKIGMVGLTIYCVGLALELAERKRSENYLQEEIDKLREEVHDTEIEADNSDGGSADA